MWGKKAVHGNYNMFTAPWIHFLETFASLISRRLQIQWEMFNVSSCQFICSLCQLHKKKNRKKSWYNLVSNGSLIYSTCEQLKESVLAEGIWFANQICPYMLECFHDTTYQAREGHSRLSSLHHHHIGFDWTAATGTQRCSVSWLLQDLPPHTHTQQVAQTTTVYLPGPRCNRWQMIRLWCNLFVLILIRDKHLASAISHRGSALM